MPNRSITYRKQTDAAKSVAAPLFRGGLKLKFGDIHVSLRHTIKNRFMEPNWTAFLVQYGSSTLIN